MSEQAAGKKILVTGGTGYIGSHTVVALQEAGYEVALIDNFENSHPQVVAQIAKITGTTPQAEHVEMRDRQEVMSYFDSNQEFDAVVHFAAYKAVGESVRKPLMYYRNNLFSLINLLEALNRFDIRNLVFSSSCTVYGQPQQLPVTESTAMLRSSSPYGNTKKISEEIIEDTIKASELKAISLRYFNPVGAHPTALLGELPIGVPNNLVPYTTQAAAGLHESLTVFGNDYPTPDGTPVRDYIHVVDLAMAHSAAVSRMLNNKADASFEQFNLGTGRGRSVLEVLETFKSETGMPLKYTIGARRPGDVAEIWADTSLAEEKLGWKAKFDLPDMLRHAWAWQQNLPDWAKA